MNDLIPIIRVTHVAVHPHIPGPEKVMTFDYAIDSALDAYGRYKVMVKDDDHGFTATTMQVVFVEQSTDEGVSDD